MTEVLASLHARLTALLAEPLDRDTEHTARILCTALVKALEDRMHSVEVTVNDRNGVGHVYTYRGVPGVPASLQPIARVQ